jgi:CRISPR-associated protein Csb1
MMPLDLQPLDGAPRLLIEAELKPLQGTRFQPTGFPNLGSARYRGPDGAEMLLVESAQSMANRMETVCWDAVEDDWIAPLRALPFVRVLDSRKARLTNSVLEAHRLNSPYIENSSWFADLKSEIGYDERIRRPIDMWKQVYPVMLKYDPNSLIHGFFLESIAGVIRSPRVLSGFIEARDVTVASSGGVKNDRVDASKSEQGGAKEGYGNVPFARDEFCGELTAYFNVDLAQIHGFGFSKEVEQLLLLLSLYKIQAVLERGLRLRTACDLEVIKLTVKTPKEFLLTRLSELEEEVKKVTEAEALKRLFAPKRVTEVTWQPKR